jgi:hypothetical protein
MYLEVEYDEDTRQWYFIQQDSRSCRWIATQTVPSQFNLGRQSITPSTVATAAVSDTETRHNQSSTAIEHNQSLSMATQTRSTVSMAAAALTLANTKPGKVHLFFRPGSGPPGGSGGHGPGGPPGRPGAIFGHIGPRGGVCGGSKLGRNPPAIFDGNRSKANNFMTEFNLYRITNHDIDHMANPMKHTALFLGFIQGPIVQAWIQHQTQWIVDQLTTGRPNTEEGYWTHIATEFQSAFQVLHHGRDIHPMWVMFTMTGTLRVWTVVLCERSKFEENLDSF